MKNYKITVNGVQYDVTVEEITGDFVQSSTPAPVSAPAPQAKPRAKSSSNVQGFKVNAPMPGTITNILVSEGASVESGQTLLMLEAMKMENEISSPVSGKVLSIQVTKGQAVQTDDILLTIEEV